jgi:hypothetical protein
VDELAFAGVQPEGSVAALDNAGSPEKEMERGAFEVAVAPRHIDLESTARAQALD